MFNNALLILEANIGNENGFCTDTANIWQTLGYILMVFKIVIPILLIVFGMIDLGKAVIASKDDEIKKATKSLLMRAIAAIIIFFIPTLIGVIMGLISSFSTQVQSDFDTCRACVSDPLNEDCESKADEAWKK